MKPLTKTEERVMELLLWNKMDKEIAKILGLSLFTVKFHVRNILEKTGCERRSELLLREIQRLKRWVSK